MWGSGEQTQAGFFLRERKMVTCDHKKVVTESYSTKGKGMLEFLGHFRNFGRRLRG